MDRSSNTSPLMGTIPLGWRCQTNLLSENGSLAPGWLCTLFQTLSESSPSAATHSLFGTAALDGTYGIPRVEFSTHGRCFQDRRICLGYNSVLRTARLPGSGHDAALHSWGSVCSRLRFNRFRRDIRGILRTPTCIWTVWSRCSTTSTRTRASAGGSVTKLFCFCVVEAVNCVIQLPC